MADSHMFRGQDFASLAVILSIPLLMGVFFGWKSRKNETMSGYYFGEKKMNPVSVGISSAVTCISAFTIIAYPAEAYIVGTVLFWAPVVIGLAAIATLFLYVPFFSKLQLPTVYTIFYLSIILYLPAVSLNAVTPLSSTWSIIIVGGVCTFYTVSGGFKAVIWTDVIQCVFMVFGCLMLLIKGLESTGGLGNVMSSLEEGNRTTFFKFDHYDISSRIHPVTIATGDFFIFTHLFGFTQCMYQRTLSCKTARQSQYAMACYLIPSTILICLSIFNGLIMYDYFKDCDPIESGLLKSLDQGASHMALLQFESMPGLAGIFVGAVFSGTLSTVSSYLNANSSVIVEDILSIALPRMTERAKVIAGKCCAFALGIISISFAFVISTLEKNAFQILRSVQGATSGVVLGIFLLGIYTPWTNSVGAVVGGCVTYSIMLWIFIGHTLWLKTTPVVAMPPVSIAGCHLANSTLDWEINSTSTQEIVTGSFTEEQEYTRTFDQVIYSLNFHYYVLSGCLLTIVFGLIVSFISGPAKPSQADPRFFMPLLSNRRLPLKVRRFFRLGVREDTESVDRKNTEMSFLGSKECEM